ncbi:hypothetical protein FQZ97_798780 [compost metagenome]
MRDGQISDDAVARHVVQRLGFADAGGAAGEHHAQAGAHFHFLHVGRQDDGGAILRIGVGGLDVEHGRLGSALVGSGIHGVAQRGQRRVRVQRHAHHRSRHGYRGGGARREVFAVVVELVVEHRVGLFDLHRNAQGARGHQRRQRRGQRLEYARAQGGLLFVVAAVADAQHHVDEGVVRMPVDDQAVVHAHGAGARARQREQAAVADGGVLHRLHQRRRIQGQIARILNPDMGHGLLRKNS